MSLSFVPPCLGRPSRTTTPFSMNPPPPSNPIFVRWFDGWIVGWLDSFSRLPPPPVAPSRRRGPPPSIFQPLEKPSRLFPTIGKTTPSEKGQPPAEVPRFVTTAGMARARHVSGKSLGLGPDGAGPSRRTASLSLHVPRSCVPSGLRSLPLLFVLLWSQKSSLAHSMHPAGRDLKVAPPKGEPCGGGLPYPTPPQGNSIHGFLGEGHTGGGCI